MAGSVILAGARTPIGKLSGSLAGFEATDLGALAIRAALQRAGLTPEQVDYVFMGQVLLGGAGQMTARQASTKAGIPMSVPSTTVNKVCLSGLNAIHLADLYIQSGEADIVVAGGMESMTNAPYLMPGARAGLRMGDSKVIDSMMFDGLFCAIDQLAMGAGTEKYAATAGISRESQDALAALSHARAVKAQAEGLFNDEIVNVEIPQRKGDPKLFSVDEGVRVESTYDSLSGLRPALVTPRKFPMVAQPSSLHRKRLLNDLALRRSVASSDMARLLVPMHRCSISLPMQSTVLLIVSA